MPIYEYECRGCQHQFEVLLLPHHQVTPACPECKSEDLERLPTGFAVSSSEMTQARVKKARSAFRNSKNRKDQQIAEGEHIREHIAESQERALNTKK